MRRAFPARRPALPGVPPEVADAVGQAEDVFAPLLVEGAAAAYPGVNAVGFALRPGCAVSWVSIFVLAAAGSTMPLEAQTVLQPLFHVCGAASSPGPVDPVFKQVDAAAGRDIEDAAEPVLDQINEGLEPAKPQLTDPCAVGSVTGVGAPWTLPAPLKRLDVVGAICD